MIGLRESFSLCLAPMVPEYRKKCRLRKQLKTYESCFREAAE